MQQLYHVHNIRGWLGGWKIGGEGGVQKFKNKQAGWLSVCQDRKGQNETKVQQNDPVIANSHQ